MPNGQPAENLPPQTKESLLRFLHSVYNEMNDTANRRNMLEQLVLFYGKPQDWHDLFQLARNEKGLPTNSNSISCGFGCWSAI